VLEVDMSDVEERESVDLLLRHGQVITMDAERRILVDGAIAVRDGRIIAAGPDREVAGAYEGSEVRDLGGALVHPGLIDSHVHANCQEVIRGFAPKASADWGGVEHVLWASRSPEKDFLGTLLSSMEMLANGTTTFCDTGSSFWLDETAQAIEEVGLRGIVGYFLLDTNVDVDPDMRDDPRFGSMPPEEAGALLTSTEEALERLSEQVERLSFRSGGRARGTLTLFGCGRCSDRLLTGAKQMADELGLPMVMHQSWGPEEVAESLALYGKRPVEHLADLGILAPNLTLVHMIHLDDRELDLVVESGTGIVHCPSASMRRGMGAIREGRFPEMLAAGVPVGLGSDGVSGKRDLLRQAYLAAVGFREVRNDIPVLTGETVLEMATLHGARVLGMADEVGSIEAGKRADLVVHTLDRPEGHPRFQDPVDNLVFYRQTATVDTVFVEGEAVLDGGRYTRFDADQAYRQIDAEAARFEQSLGAAAFTSWPLVE
jgi:5-methylthioadenosine/S-adenosylhomocysteine deaminase